jgi:hypothetical protein
MSASFAISKSVGPGFLATKECIDQRFSLLVQALSGFASEHFLVGFCAAAVGNRAFFVWPPKNKVVEYARANLHLVRNMPNSIH